MSRRRCCGPCVIWPLSPYFDLGAYDQISGNWSMRDPYGSRIVYSTDTNALLLHKTPGVFGTYGCSLFFSPAQVNNLYPPYGTDYYSPYGPNARIVFAAEDADNFFYLTFSDKTGGPMPAPYFMTFYLYRRQGGSDTLLDSKQVCVGNNQIICDWNGPSALTWWPGGVRFQHSNWDNYGGRLYSYDGDMGSGMRWGLGTSATNSGNVGWVGVQCSKAKELCGIGTCALYPALTGNGCLPRECQAARTLPPARDLILPDEFSVAIAGNSDYNSTGCPQFDGTYVLQQNDSIITDPVYTANYGFWNMPPVPGTKFWNYTLPSPFTVTQQGFTLQIIGLELAVGPTQMIYGGNASVYWIGHAIFNGQHAVFPAVSWRGNPTDALLANWSNEPFSYYYTMCYCNMPVNNSTCLVTALE